VATDDQPSGILTSLLSGLTLWALVGAVAGGCYCWDRLSFRWKYGKIVAACREKVVFDAEVAGPIEGRILVCDDKGRRRPVDGLRPELLAGKAAEVETVVFVRESRHVVGTYSPLLGGGRHTPARDLVYSVAAVDASSLNLVAARTFCIDPPTVWSSTDPDEQEDRAEKVLASWLAVCVRCDAAEASAADQTTTAPTGSPETPGAVSPGDVRPPGDVTRAVADQPSRSWTGNRGQTLETRLVRMELRGQPFRSWTDNRGRTIEARLVSVESGGAVVVLEKRSGKTGSCGYETLSSADQDYVRTAMAGGAAGAGGSP